MAKSVYQKKKRIAHFQNPIENFTEGECIFDYVSSIIQNMDDSFNSVHSSSKEHPETKLININGQRDSLSNANAPSTSNDSQNEKKSKSNKFSVSRKYPLMEKTQKILKQLKHNRRIPKPRAHLSSLPELPLKKVDYKVSTVQKMKQKGGRKLKNNISLYNAHVFDDSILKTSHMDNDSKISNCKISENFSKVEKHGKAENTVYENSSTHSSRNDLYNSNRKTGVNVNVEKNSLCNADNVKDSENDTTDSEYERFVKRNKKGLQKKVLKKQKHSITKRKTSEMESIKISKSAVQRENIPKQYDSDDSDSDNMLASVSSNFKKASPFKKLRVISDMPTEVETGNVLNEESEPEMFADDVCTRDSSLESDIADNETSITNRTKPLSEKNVCSMLYETNSLSDLSSKSDTLPDIGSFINKEDGSETSHLIVNNIVPNNSSPFSSHINTSDSDKTKPNNLSPNLLVIDLCDSDDECRNIMFDGLSNVSIPKKEKCIVTDVAIDLCDSDNDDKNDSTGEPSNVLVPKKEKCVINVNCPDSEEFDLEIIEITPARSSKSHCIISKASSVYDEACQAVQTDIKNNIGNKHMQTVIKTEVSGNVHIPVTSDVENQNKKSDDSKYDAVYMTNICSDLKKDELVCPESTCSVSSVHNKNIKTEMPEIFIDSVKGVRYSGDILKMDMHHNYQHQKYSDLPINFYRENTTVKNECSLENLSSLEKKYSVDCVSSRSKDTPFSENILKSFDICSNSKMFTKNFYSGTCDGEQKFQELEQMNISHLLELFKKEFQTYQEIIQAEANVEASLKVLETHQAEKLKYIRSLVQKYVGSNQDLCKIAGSSVKEQRNSILPKNETLNTFKTLTADKPPMFTLIDLSNDTEDSTYQNAEGNRFSEVPSGSIFSQTAVLTSKIDNDIKVDVCRLDELQNVQQLQHSVMRSKHEAESSPKDLNLIVYSSKFQSGGKQTLKLLKEKCNVCGKEAMAACQRCAKVFFCSHDCGKLFWINGHENECGK